MKTVEELQQYYQQEIVPHLAALETMRKQQLKRVMFMWIAGFASLLLGFLTMIPMLILVFLLLSLLMYFFIFGFKRNRPDFRTEYKKIVIEKLMQFIEPDLAFTPNLFITQSKYDFSKIFLCNPDIYSGEDLVAGKIERTQVEFCELHTQDRQTDSKGRTHYVTIFKGLFFIADFNKHFNGQTYVQAILVNVFSEFSANSCKISTSADPMLFVSKIPNLKKYLLFTAPMKWKQDIFYPRHLWKDLLNSEKQMNSSVQLSFVRLQCIHGNSHEKESLRTLPPKNSNEF